MSQPAGAAPNRSDLIVGGLFLALGVYLTVSAGLLPSAPGGIPGAGFFPRVVGVVTILLSVMLLWSALKGAEPSQFALQHRRVIGGVAGLIFVYLLLWGTGLFALRTFVFLALFLRFLEQSWRTSATVAGALTAAIAAAFQYGLRVSLD
jgi:hypothetical protein